MHFIYLSAFVCSLIRSIDRHTHRQTHRERTKGLRVSFLILSKRQLAHVLSSVREYLVFFSLVFIFKHSDGTWIWIELPRCRIILSNVLRFDTPETHQKSNQLTKRERKGERNATIKFCLYAHCVAHKLTLLSFAFVCESDKKWEEKQKQQSVKTTNHRKQPTNHYQFLCLGFGWILLSCWICKHFIFAASNDPSSPGSCPASEFFLIHCLDIHFVLCHANEIIRFHVSCAHAKSLAVPPK